MKWIKHDGFADPRIKGNPWVEVQFRDGDTAEGRMFDWDQNWQWQDSEDGFDAPGAIVAYRLPPPPNNAKVAGGESE